MRNFLRILRYIIPYWGFASLNVIFNLLAATFSLISFTMITPFLGLLFGIAEPVTDAPALSLNYKDIIANFYFLLTNIKNTYGPVTTLMFVSIVFVIFSFLANSCRFLGQFFMANLRNGVVKDLRNDLYFKILILPLSFFFRKKKGDIISRMTADVFEIEWSIMNSLLMIFREPFTIAIFMTTLLLISVKLTLTALIILPPSIILIGIIGKSLKRTSDAGQKKMGEIISVIEESITGLRVIKAFNAINMAMKKFRVINNQYTSLMIRIYRRRDLAAPLSEFLGALILVVIIWIGGSMVLNESTTITADVLILFVVVFARLVPSAQAFVTASYTIQKGIASAERIFQILDAEEVITEKPNAIVKKTFDNHIEYHDVDFTYKHAPVLNQINLTIEKGKTIAIVGPSGAGKSTMVDLIPRFYDCTGGQILIDEIPIKDYIIRDVRAMMGIVTQDTILFNDSVLNNISFGLDNTSEEKVIEAAKVANAHNFIMEMKDGYLTHIGDRGVKLSGGQRQRISIARAVLRNPSILILDEATSSLDTESERLVQEALEKLMENRTSIVIAHRLSTIKKADEIIVLNKGVIVEKGTHKELSEKNGLYKKLLDMQSFDN
ncbi:ABC transporter ATP-binding protein [Bacteroidota bacterium]